MLLGTVILDENGIKRTLTRIANEILEKNKDIEDIVLVGVDINGYLLAQRISNIIKLIKDVSVPIEKIDVTFTKGNFSKIEVRNSEIGIDINNKKVVIIDDVISTGQTATTAIASVLRHGWPSTIQFAVLIDKGHRLFPITPNYAGKNIPSSKNLKVSVELEEVDKCNCVKIYEN